METHQLPYRFRESVFREYEPAIRLIVERFPSCVEFDPQGRAQETFACRLRDSLTSLKQNRWPTIIDMDKFDSICNLICVRQVANGHILVGGWNETKPKPTTSGITPVVALPPPVSSSDGSVLVHSLEEKKLLALLASRRLLATPLVVGGLSLAEATKLEQDYDIALTQNNDGTHTLI